MEEEIFLGNFVCVNHPTPTGNIIPAQHVVYRNVNGQLVAMNYGSAPLNPRSIIYHRTLQIPSENPAAKPVYTGIKKVDPMLKKLSKLLVTGFNADFVIIAGGKEFKIHKCVLAMHSAVFEAMLSNDYEENRSSQLKITDYDSDTVKDFVHYLYNGEVESNVNAMHLYILADQYDVEGLKSIAEEIILKSINEANAVDVFVLGNRYAAEKLTFKAYSQIQKMFPGQPLKRLLENPAKIIELVQSKKDFEATWALKADQDATTVPPQSH